MYRGPIDTPAAFLRSCSSSTSHSPASRVNIPLAPLATTMTQKFADEHEEDGPKVESSTTSWDLGFERREVPVGLSLKRRHIDEVIDIAGEQIALAELREAMARKRQRRAVAAAPILL